MDELPDSLLLQILSRLDDSADVARCRVASKAFDTVFPDLRSIDLACTLKWHLNSVSKFSIIKPFKDVFLHLLSVQKVVESVCIGPKSTIPCDSVDPKSQDLYITDGNFAKKWLPRVSESLKSLSISDLCYPSKRQSNVLVLISAYCHNLVNLKLKFAALSVDNLNPMPMLTSLTLSSTRLEDQHLNELNKCFPNLQVLNLVAVNGLKHPKIHLLRLQTCHLVVLNNASSWTLITPNLITLRIECRHFNPGATMHIEAPMLSAFHLSLYSLKYAGAFTVKKLENLKTLLLVSLYAGSLLSEFPITKTLQTLTLGSRRKSPRDATNVKLTLRKVFTVFPNLSSLSINSSAWSELEACLNTEDWEILDGRNTLKTIHAHLMLVDPSLTFSSVARVLDQCVCLSEVLLLIHDYVVGTVSKSFMSKCMARWPGLKWRWGTWNKDMERFFDVNTAK